MSLKVFLLLSRVHHSVLTRDIVLAIPSVCQYCIYKNAHDVILFAPSGRNMILNRRYRPLSLWPHLFCGAGHEKRRGEQLKWSLAIRLYIGSFPCA